MKPLNADQAIAQDKAEDKASRKRNESNENGTHGALTRCPHCGKTSHIVKGTDAEDESENEEVAEEDANKKGGSDNENQVKGRNNVSPGHQYYKPGGEQQAKIKVNKMLGEFARRDQGE